MKRLFGLFAIALLVMSAPSRALAGVDLTPNPNAPGLHIKALDKTAGTTTKVANAKNPYILKATKTKKPPNCDDLQGIFDACLDDVIMPREEPDDPEDPDDPELTLGQILTAVRELTLPALKINIQPGGETLINFDTIFYAQPQPFQRSITLLDYDIDIKATPTTYTWHHGDGTSHTTSTPGAAYPSKAVTHRYKKKAKDLRPSVDVTYTVTFRIDNGPWQDLGQTLTANGPAGTVDVLEATAVLTRY